MHDKTGKLLKKVEKAGIRQSLKRNHILNRSELLGLKVQIMSPGLRISFGMAAVGTGAGAWHLWQAPSPLWSVLLWIASFGLLLFSIFGVKRTVSRLLDNMDLSSAGDLVGLVLEGIGSALGALSD